MTAKEFSLLTKTTRTSGLQGFLSRAAPSFCFGVLGAFLFGLVTTKPVGASWATWPTKYMIGLFQKTTAPDAREYLGIAVGTPGEDGTASAAEIQGDSDNLYFSLGDGTWIRVGVDTILAPVELETGTGYVLLENGNFTSLDL